MRSFFYFISDVFSLCYFKYPKNFIYVGFSSEVEVRIKRHNDKLNKSTAPYAPFNALLIEKVSEIRSEARIREKYWKSGTGKRKLKILKNNLNNK